MSDLQLPSEPGKDLGENVQENPVRDVSSDVETGEVASQAEIERIYGKIDRRIIPAFWVLYFLCSAVRSNVSLAQTMNTSSGHDLASVLHLSEHQISTGLALFYVCYVVFEVPSNLVMTKISPHVWMSRIVISVGIIGSCMAAMKAAWSLYLLRLLLGVVIAGMWPGMTYYLTLFYPPSRIGKRIGQYFTAAQVSAAVVGLVSAGFQKMDTDGGLVGFQWMFLLYGLITLIVGFALLWWLPDRPRAPHEQQQKSSSSSSSSSSSHRFLSWLPHSAPVLTGRDAEVHYQDLKRVYHYPQWSYYDLLRVFLDWRLWPLLVMYFGVVGVGIGVESYGNVIIEAADPSLSGIDVSLLFAPIWIMDLIAILLVTPLSDRFHNHRALFFSIPVCIQILGLLLTTYAGTDSNPWPRYGGLLIVGFGLGPTVPIVMTWTAEIFQPRHGEVGVAVASAVVSGWGNLGSIVTTYALYAGWKSDADAKGRAQYRNSNIVMIAILVASIVAAIIMQVAMYYTEKKGSSSTNNNDDDHNDAAPSGLVDGAARREQTQRGLDGLGSSLTKFFRK
ncbi:hypothetical protein ASPZODRAFT_129715 [Penicilliopsis zonata CBS 506.65]|uniref:Major facilitator superfamily (MFS) profile domain-containing protein n=1 Tax=Penicilliopsis zonata CBS 506.65 TaxID=1073090 RepID=A0A1L9SPU7_9EURO|nr:hypothetical protein ASPZODRAFT_129715 [Penicilliopsis zonata CBS 506.65]OJJ49282.1 hypothetical protein ASPZODRAFT_129715 [Penicilliopsis zonata CBS 506.65]